VASSAMPRALSCSEDAMSAYDPEPTSDPMSDEDRFRPEAVTGTLGYVRRSGDAVSEFDWAGDGAERFKAFTGAKDRHVAIVKQSPED
jgi:hypothetical protein